MKSKRAVPVVVEVERGRWLWALGGAMWHLDAGSRRWEALAGGRLRGPYGGRVLPLSAVAALVAVFGAPCVTNLPTYH